MSDGVGDIDLYTPWVRRRVAGVWNFSTENIWGNFNLVVTSWGFVFLPQVVKFSTERIWGILIWWLRLGVLCFCLGWWNVPKKEFGEF